MNNKKKRITFVSASVLLITPMAAGYAQQPASGGDTRPVVAKNAMTFFVTSTGSGKGADFGGLAGADRHCQTLAAAAGFGSRVWRAYLSTTPTATTPAVNARDRIGSGPWHNAQGVLIANTVEELHGAGNHITKETGLTEKGAQVNGRGDDPNLHDILTGSQPDGTAVPGDADTTCGNWTKSGEGAAIVGHHDRRGLSDEPAEKSWNSSHPTKGCSQDALRSTGGDGRLYCFAAK